MTDSALELLQTLGHEEVVIVRDPPSGLQAVIAIHDTSLGPAVGGTRMRLYPSFDQALIDALRLSRAMSYKAALANMARGGGKAVIVGDPARDKSSALLSAYARALDRLGGRFHTGCDMGFSLADAERLGRLSPHVSHTRAGSGMDTADFAALGVFESIRAVAGLLDQELASLRVAIQGLGQLGWRLAQKLHEAGSALIVSDTDPALPARAARELGAASVPPEAIFDVEADLFSPNAAGSVLNRGSIARLRCRAVVGGANEQLADAAAGDLLHQRGILYAPDYVVNAGGLLSLLFEVGECDQAATIERVRAIGPRLAGLIEQSGAEGVPTHRLVDRLAEQRLAAARARRGTNR